MSDLTFELNSDNELSTVITYGDKKLVFLTPYVASVSKTTVTTSAVFDPVNRFLNTCWKDFKDKIFDSYFRLYTIMNEVNDFIEGYSKCQKELCVLFETLTFNVIRNWVGDSNNPNNGSMLATPDNLVSAHYTDTSSSGTTFHEAEYRDLLVLSIISRFMVPIWGHFMVQYINGMQPEFKEKTVFNLLDPTWVRNCDIMTFVENYINEGITSSLMSKKKEGKPDIRSINIGGISTHELPMYLIAMTMLRRMSSMDLYGRGNENSNLVNVLYSYAISNLLLQLPNKLSGTIAIKKTTDTNNADGHRDTIADKCRVSQTQHAGIHAVHEFYANRFMPKIQSDLIALINSCSYSDVPKVDVTFISRVLPTCIQISTLCNDRLSEIDGDERIIAHNDVDIYRKKIVANWIGNVFNHAEIEALNAVSFSGLCGLLTAILIDMGHVDLAIILNSVPVLTDESKISDGSSIDSRHCDLFIELYPRHEQFSEKERNRTGFLSKMNNARRDKNKIVRAIEELTALIPYIIWKSAILPSHLTEWGITNDDLIGKLYENGQYIAYHNRKLLLINSFIHLGKINQ